MKEYSKEYYKNNKEYWKEYRDKSKGLYLYYYKNLNYFTRYGAYYLGSTVNMEMRNKRHKSQEVEKYLIVNKIPYAIYCLNLDDIQHLEGYSLTEKELRQVEQYMINSKIMGNKELNQKDAVKEDEYDYLLASEIVTLLNLNQIKWKLYKYEDYGREKDDTFMDSSYLKEEIDVDINEIKLAEGYVIEVRDGVEHRIWEEEHI